MRDAGKPTTRGQSDCRPEQSARPQHTARARALDRRGGPASSKVEATLQPSNVHPSFPSVSKYMVCAEWHVNSLYVLARAGHHRPLEKWRQCGIACATVEPWPAQSVDRAAARDEGGGLAIANQGVVLDPRCGVIQAITPFA